MTIGRVHQPLRSLVSDELRRLVVTGELAPGTRIVEDRLLLDPRTIFPEDEPALLRRLVEVLGSAPLREQGYPSEMAR